MRRYKNAYFYAMGIKPGKKQPIIPTLYCIPKSVISSCIRDIVEDHCGAMTADLVKNYILYSQYWFDEARKSAGLNSSICDNIISFDKVPSKLPPRSGHTKLGISRLLEITAPGTALDTVWGKLTQAYLYIHSRAEELCTTANVGAAYGACVQSSDDKSEKSEFNILQFAHQQLGPPDHGSQCSRLEQFTACWNLLKEICGSKARGFEQHAALLVESCRIESEMDTVVCHWKDMLLPDYIQASRVTVWPIDSQCLKDPVFLEGAPRKSFNSLMDDLDTVISLLKPGVQEMFRKCGSQPAKRLRLLLNKLSYLQRDALKYLNLYHSSLPDFGN